MPGPRAVQNLQMPQPRDWQGGKMPRSCPGGSGGWAQVELTDALSIKLKIVTAGIRCQRYVLKA